MAGLDDLDKEYNKKIIEGIKHSFEYMDFVYSSNKKSFVRNLYSECAFTCSEFKTGEDSNSYYCDFSSIANNYPIKKECEHLYNSGQFIKAILKVFGINGEKAEKNALALWGHIIKDGYVSDKSCKQYNGGPFSVLFSDPSYMEVSYFVVDKIAGNIEEINIVQITKTYISQMSNAGM